MFALLLIKLIKFKMAYKMAAKSYFYHNLRIILMQRIWVIFWETSGKNTKFATELLQSLLIHIGRGTTL